MPHLVINANDRNDLIRGRDIINILLTTNDMAVPTQHTTAPTQDAQTSSAAVEAAQAEHPALQGPRLQLEVLRVLAASPTGTMTSYEVAAALGMSQPVYAKKIRGTGRAPNQVQDVLYHRGWAYPNGPQSRVRRYEITSEGRQVAAAATAA